MSGQDLALLLRSSLCESQSAVRRGSLENRNPPVVTICLVWTTHCDQGSLKVSKWTGFLNQGPFGVKTRPNSRLKGLEGGTVDCGGEAVRLSQSPCHRSLSPSSALPSSGLESSGRIHPWSDFSTFSHCHQLRYLTAEPLPEFHQAEVGSPAHS